MRRRRSRTSIVIRIARRCRKLESRAPTAEIEAAIADAAGGLVVEVAGVDADVDAAAIAEDAAVAADDTSHGFSRIHTDKGCALARPFLFGGTILRFALSG